MGKKKSNVTHFRRTFDIQIQYIVLAVVVIYIGVILVNFMQSDRVIMYEVVQADIAEDNTYTGIILRNETVYYTNKKGYINYYMREGDKIAKGETVYTLDETGSVYELLKNAQSGQVLSEEDTSKVRTAIAAYRKDFDKSNFSSVNDFKYDLKNILLDLSSVDTLSDLEKITSQENVSNSFHIITSEKSGVISYHTDSMETITKDTVTAELFEQNGNNTTLKEDATDEMAEAGAPAYKLVNSEDWSVIIPLSDEQYSKLKAEETISVLFKKDNIRTDATVQTFKKGNTYFAELAFNKYMVRYINERYIKIEITLYEKNKTAQDGTENISSDKGLKIPVSAILEKEFSLIPKEYLMEEGTSNVSVIKEYVNEENEISFQKIELPLFYENESFVFVDSDKLQTGDRLKSPDETNETLYVYGTDIEKLEGVYNINKGYAVFNVIERLTENSEYVIVKQNTSNGLSVYDRIALDKDTIQESDLVK